MGGAANSQTAYTRHNAHTRDAVAQGQLTEPTERSPYFPLPNKRLHRSKLETRCVALRSLSLGQMTCHQIVHGLSNICGVVSSSFQIFHTEQKLHTNEHGF